MTLDEAIQAATTLLEQRGQLLNMHLIRLVEGDKDLFREVRERLIQDGLAEERSGAGLARIGAATKDRSDVSAGSSVDIGGNFASSGRSSAFRQADWWLMTSGAIRGPLDLAELCHLRRSGKIMPADVVRHGTQGLWRQPDDVPELAASKPDPVQRPKSFRIRDRRIAEWESDSIGPGGRGRSESTKNPYRIAAMAVPPEDNETTNDRRPDFAAVDENVATIEPAPVSKRFIPAEEILSLGNQKRPGWLGRSWNLMADLVGGSRRLALLLLTIISAGSFLFWWWQPPPSRTIYNEFVACRAAIMKLQDRRAKRSDWAPVVERYRPRVQSLVDRLKTRATDRNPIQKSLYLAGMQGLLPLLENPVDPTAAERLFAQHIGNAQNRLDRRSVRPSPANPPK